MEDRDDREERRRSLLASFSSSSSLSSSNSSEGETGESVNPEHSILIVEDFDMTSSFLSNSLKFCRAAKCVCASTAEEAMQIISERGVFDLILTDVMMSGIGG